MVFLNPFLPSVPFRIENSHLVCDSSMSLTVIVIATEGM